MGNYIIYSRASLNALFIYRIRLTLRVRQRYFPELVQIIALGVFHENRYRCKSILVRLNLRRSLWILYRKGKLLLKHLLIFQLQLLCLISSRVD